MTINPSIAFHQGLELGFMYGALTCSALGLVLRTRDYNLTPFFGARGRG